MKKKKTFLALAVVLLAMTAQAQMKIQSDGHISLGTLSGAWNAGTQIYPSGAVHFNHPGTENWQWVTVASPNAATGKCWIVTYPNNKYDHRFFVTGNGYTYSRGSWRLSDESVLAETSEIRGARAVLDQITGVWYTPAGEEHGRGGDRKAGVAAKQVAEVLPEAVTTDENGLMYVDYEALTVFLLEALKEQGQEMELLRKALEEHGLVEEKP